MYQYIICVTFQCVQKCSKRNVEVLLVLQSLLQNHCRNINLFLECKGLALFQRYSNLTLARIIECRCRICQWLLIRMYTFRDFLQLDVCLQLLATVTESYSEAVELIAGTDIREQLRDFLHLYGPQSKVPRVIVLCMTRQGK